MASLVQSTTHGLPTLKQSILQLGELVRDPASNLPEEELPGLDGLIKDWYDDNVEVNNEQFFNRMLGVFKNSTHHAVYDQVLGKLPESHQNAINAFVDGTQTADQISQVLRSAANKNEVVAENHIIENPVAHYTLANKAFSVPSKASEYIKAHQKTDYEFKNWGENIKFTPAITYYPQNTEEVKTIVKDSVQNGRGIRVSGFRHSWAPVFGRNNLPHQRNNGDVMISTLTELNAGTLPNLTTLPSSLFQPAETELNHIQRVDHAYVNGPVLGDGKQYIRVGTSTTNEQFRRWCINSGRVTLPMNIIEVEITMGGANAPICHGAGLQHATLSDLVRAIEYVDVNGELQKVDMSDPQLLKAAAGCFGLLGVVTHITYECEPIATAVMRPVKLDVIQAIPPPPEMKDADIPEPLRPAKPLTAEEKKRLQEDFERRANTDYYAEWFWFPYSSKVWVNTWSTDKDTANVVAYPSNLKTTIQVFATITMNVAQIIVQKIHALEVWPYQQTALLSWLATKNLDEVAEGQPSIRALIPDALHFQRGVTNIRVRDMEVEFPLQAKPGTQDRDYTNVQRAWWQAILECYAHKDTCPQRMPLEMRIMGSSEVTMAPQRGHHLGTCSIEILTLHAAADIWQPYAQRVLDKWMSLKDSQGAQLRVRPHWAKEWDSMQVDGKPWREGLKQGYASEIAEFKNLLAAIGRKQNWTLADLKRTFSNELLDYLYLDDVVATAYPVHHHSILASLEKAVHVVEEKVLGLDIEA